MFQTTIWSELAGAGAKETAATDAFVTRYRPPLLAFLRRRGVSPEDAEDVAQEVFLRLFARDLLARADREKGRFRSYLLGVTTNVLGDRLRRARAQKRGGGHEHVSLHAIGDAAADPKANADFDACWVSHLVGRALEAVQRENARQHELLGLAADGLAPREIAERLGRTPGQVRTDLSRARKRLATAVSAEVARYCSSQEEYEAELKAILGRL
jgi:RNA polymerase sigma-70 factor (ECF subfamily)